MSVNRERPHIWVLPEDDANRQLANGFHLQVEWGAQRQMQVLPEAGGWREVLALFRSEHISGMDRYPTRFMVLLFDLDGRIDRLHESRDDIPVHLRDRVFILGSLTEPEAMKAAGLGSYEKIGSELAKDCREGTEQTWDHELLRHNADELERLRARVRPILFS